MAPYLEQLSFGVIAGFASGYALKKLGKVMAFALGLLFIAIQVLAYYNFVSISWIEIENAVKPLLEAESITQMWRALVQILTHNVTFAGSFIPGLILGLRRG
jgi:uncharacterized membrane protein (Fun14 family)